MPSASVPLPHSLLRPAFRLLNRVVEPAVRAGLANPLPIGVGGLVVETTGRVTGRTRSVPVAALRVGRTVVVTTVRPHSNWLANLEATPEHRVWLAGRPRHSMARVRCGPLNVATLSLAA